MIGPTSMTMPKYSRISRKNRLIAPDFGARSRFQPMANRIKGIAIGIRMMTQATLRNGMSVRSTSQASTTARQSESAVPAPAIQNVRPSTT